MVIIITHNITVLQDENLMVAKKDKQIKNLDFVSDLGSAIIAPMHDGRVSQWLNCQEL